MICESIIKRLAVQHKIDCDNTTECDAIAFARAIEKAFRRAALEEAYQACMTCDGALNNAGACAMKIRALSNAKEE